MRRFLTVCAAVAALSFDVRSRRSKAGRVRRPGPRGGRRAAASGRAQAPFDLTGYWVALVTDDWRYRMLTPPKGNVDYLPVNAEARRVMGEWDPAKDEAAGEACRGYGAGGVMRLPGRLHITWENDNAAQDGSRRRHADAPVPVRPAPAAPPARPTWQGTFHGALDAPRRPRPRAARRPGSCAVTTTRLRPGYLRKNGDSVQRQRRASPSTSSGSSTKGRSTWR